MKRDDMKCCREGMLVDVCLSFTTVWSSLIKMSVHAFKLVVCVNAP